MSPPSLRIAVHPSSHGSGEAVVVAGRRHLPDLSRAPSRTRTATASATSPASSPASTTSSSLGVDAVWISPFYPSPMADFGYDVADYTRRRPHLRHPRRLRPTRRRHPRPRPQLILDFVPNHTSDQHPWFLESRALPRQPEARLVPLARPRTRTAAACPTTGCPTSAAPPGPSTSTPGSSTYHSFLSQQPDLNWRNPESATPSTPPCASGSTAASTASAWTSSGCSSRTTSSATTRRTPTGARAAPPSAACCRSTPPTAPRPTRSSPRCAPLLDAVPGARPHRRDLPSAHRTRHLLRRRPRTPPTSAAPICRSTSTSSRPRGRPTTSRASSATTKACCPPAHGPTGCSATTTSRVSPPASARHRPASRPCSC